MAGISWIKIETTLPNKPVVMRLRRILGKDHNTVVGLLVRLLCWADGVTCDGSLSDMTAEDVDYVVGCDGFGEALVQAGWLISDDSGLRFKDWDCHNGATAKRRAMKARGMEMSRCGQNVDKNVHKIPQDVHLDKIRIDKRENTKRESPGFVTQGKHTTTSTHMEISYEGATSFVPTQGREKDFLDAFCRRPKDGNMFRREYANAVKEIGDEETLIECARLAVASERENEGNIRFLPTPENWLADHRYRDYQGMAKTTKPLKLIDIY